MQEYVRIHRPSGASTVALRAAAFAIAFAIALTVFLPWVEGTRGPLDGRVSMLDLAREEQYERVRPYRDLALMIGGLLLVLVTCSGSTRNHDERRRAIGRGAAFALAALPACDLILGNLFFDQSDDALTVHVGAYAAVALAAAGVTISSVSSCLGGRDDEPASDDGAGKVSAAICWAALVGYLVVVGSFAMEQVSASLEGEARRDLYGHYAAMTALALFGAALPWAAWLISRVGGDAVYVRVSEAGVMSAPAIPTAYVAAPAYPFGHVDASIGDLEHPREFAMATDVWGGSSAPRRAGGPYMYAAREGVIVWEDGRCAVPVSKLHEDAPVIVVGAVGPFHQVRLPAGVEGVVVKSELRW